MKKTNKFLSVALVLSFLLSCAAFFPAGAQGDINNEVYVGGQPFGVRLYSDGAMVVELQSFYDGEKYVCPAKDGGLKENDVITAANGERVTTNEDLKTAVENCGGSITLTVERNDGEEEKTVTPVKNTVGVYLLGAWVRDSCAGIGTVTYYDPTDGYFAALGHGICDADTGTLLTLGSGDVVLAEINGTTKSVSGKVGTLSGFFTETAVGSLTDNTEMGIFGTIANQNFLSGEKYQIADPNEVSTGKAVLVTSIDGSTPLEYEIEIKRIRNHSSGSNENFTIKITDKRLIEACGGIVQGMSGSPILQNGKLAGAVTHVLVNNPEEGYGVFARYMADEKSR